MALGSSGDTLAILYDNENTPFEMLDFALKKAKSFLPCRMIVVADWDECPEQKRWQKLMSRPGFTFRQIERTRDGENSLDYALAATAMMMCREGVTRFMFITNDADFADIAKALRQQNPNVFLVGVGAEQANGTLRSAYNNFICFKGRQDGNKGKVGKKADGNDAANEEGSAEEAEMKDYEGDELKLQTNVPRRASVVLSKGSQSKVKRVRRKNSSSDDNSVVNATKGKGKSKVDKKEKTAGAADKAGKTQEVEINGDLSVRIPKTLHQQLMDRAAQENVDMGQLVTFLLMQGISK